MYVGKTLFAQLMDFVPWTSFRRIVARYDGDRRVRSLNCAEQFRVLAFAQLTWRESLRDIEACLSAQANKLYHMGLREAVARATLADANEARDWRIWHELAQLLIRRARRMYATEALGVDLDNTVYALDSTTIDLCLAVFPWAHFRSTKAAVKMHTLLDLRGNIPSFIHVSDGKLHDVNVLDLLVPEPGAFYVMDRGYIDYARLYVLHQAAAFFVTRAKANLDARRVYSALADRSSGVICDQTIALNGFYAAKDYPEYLRRIRFKTPDTEPPRDSRRLHFLRGWSHEQAKEVLTGSQGAGRAHGPGAPGRTRFAVGGDRFDCGEDRLHGGDLARLGAPGRTRSWSPRGADGVRARAAQGARA